MLFPTLTLRARISTGFYEPDANLEIEIEVSGAVAAVPQ
jgi:hypothetical protein